MNIFIGIITGLLLGIIFFYCTIHAYILGIKHYKAICNNQIPEVNINPVKIVRDAVKEIKESKKEDIESNNMDEIFSYSKESAIESLKLQK